MSVRRVRGPEERLELEVLLHRDLLARCLAYGVVPPSTQIPVDGSEYVLIDMSLPKALVDQVMELQARLPNEGRDLSDYLNEAISAFLDDLDAASAN